MGGDGRDEFDRLTGANAGHQARAEVRQPSPPGGDGLGLEPRRQQIAQRAMLGRVGEFEETRFRIEEIVDERAARGERVAVLREQQPGR